MNAFLQQILALLDTEAGNLVYHLVLAFSIAGALQISLNQANREPKMRFRRTIIGLGVLLILQVSLFIGSGLAWQGLFNGSVWLPPLDRTVTLLSLVIIIWLWAFPDSVPTADVITLVLFLLILTAGIIGAMWWSEQGPILFFNGSLVDMVSQIAALVLIAFGCLILVIRQPEGWGYGLSMLILMSIGNILHFLLLPYGVDYPSAGRLGQMIAYPMLLALPQRFQSVVHATTVSDEIQQDFGLKEKNVPEYSHLLADPQVWHSLINLASESEPKKVAKAIVSSIAKTMEADMCFLLMPPDEAGKITISYVYDRFHQRFIEGIVVDSTSVPALSSAMRMGRVRRLPAISTAPDLNGLSGALDLERLGNLLFIPVLSADGRPTSGVALMSPYTDKDWSTEEQSFLNVYVKLLVHFLQRSRELSALKTETTQLRHLMRLAQDQMQQTAEERQKLRDQIVVLEENAQKDQAEVARMAVLVAAQEAIRNTLEQLKIENDQLKKSVRATHSIGPSDGELRLALQEIAHLKAALSEANDKIETMKLSYQNALPNTRQLEDIVTITQDLRQPLSSIIGYTDFLLSESIGILGLNQRKYLERIMLSTERLSKIIDDLVHTASAESKQDLIDLMEINLSAVIEKAIRETDEHLGKKNIILRVRLPDHPLLLTTDRFILRKILVNLLRNAGDVTPNGGNVLMNASLETADGEQDYILVQITDGGVGISPNDLPLVLSPLEPGAKPIVGVSNNGIGLSNVKVMVGMLGGRAWVDSEKGHGATYSVLVPVKPPSLVDVKVRGQE